MSKLFICGITKSGELENLKELLEPLIPYYDGLQFVIHNPKDGETDKYLESIKKDGKIIYTDFCQRLDFSRNNFLFNGTMKTGDFFIILDSSERLFPEFFKYWEDLKKFLEENHIDGVALYGKRFLFRFTEFLEFRGNPHEGLHGANRIVELTKIDRFKDTSWFWGSSRNKREKTHFIFHYLKYYTYPQSNQCLLGCNDMERFKKRDIIRQKFRQYCERLDLLPITIENFKWICNNRLDEVKNWINEEKILNDAYRFYILNKDDFNDDHDYNNMVKI